MELEELRSEWMRREQALATALHANTLLLRENFVTQQTDRLCRAGPMGPLELVIWIGFVAAFALFLAHHFGEWRFFVPAAALEVWTIAVGIVTLRDRAALRALDFSRPPLELQRRIAALRLRRARIFQWAFLTGQIVWWIPLAIVLFKGLMGVDLYGLSDFMRRFIAWNLVGGVLFIPLALAAARVLAPRLSDTAVGRGFVDGVAGRDIAQARAMVARLAAFDSAG